MPTLSRAAALIAVSLMVVVLVAAEFAYRPPAPRDAGAPLDEFSAARAEGVLARILGDQSPHPLGTEANDAVRARVLAELTDLGLAPTVQTALVSHRGAVARVHNILARIEGPAQGAVLLAAHHDSVGAGPGAGDDGAGVAAMVETARALLRGPRLPHPVILLIDDGEELGLYGARAFCEHPWAKEVAVVLNFEARGTCGASLLFETAGADLWTMRKAAEHLARPITGSSFAAVYRTLPNGTDLSVFAQHGMRGANFAFVGGARRYHTPLDDLAHLDRGSLQHHGDNMLRMARALAGAEDLATRHSERALFFDVLARAVVVLPLDAELPACGGLMLAWLVLLLGQHQRGRLRVRSLVIASTGALAAVVVAAAAGFGLTSILHALGRLPTPFPPSPAAHELCYGLAGVATALATLALVGRRVDRWHVVAGTGGFLSLLAVAIAAALPGSSYPIFVAAAGAWLVALLPGGARGPLALCTVVAATVVAVVFAPFFALLPSAIGLAAGHAHAALAALAVLALPWLWPALLGRRLADAAAVTGLASACAVGLVLLAPIHDRDHPARANLVHVSLAGKPPLWSLGDADFLSTPNGRPKFRTRPLPWLDEGWCTSTADLRRLAEPAVEWERERRGGDQFVLRGSMRSRRGAPWLALCLPADLSVLSATVAGAKVDPARSADRSAPSGRSTEWRTLAFLGAREHEAVTFEIRFRGRSRRAPYVFDRSLGLPAEAEADAAKWTEARANALAAPIHLGDGSIVAVPLSGW
ncbi:MAG: M28 family peptidase [Planctomycetota bacterium]